MERDVSPTGAEELLRKDSAGQVILSAAGRICSGPTSEVAPGLACNAQQGIRPAANPAECPAFGTVAWPWLSMQWGGFIRGQFQTAASPPDGLGYPAGVAGVGETLDTDHGDLGTGTS